MDEKSKQDSGPELLSTTEAVREARGKVSYYQLWRAIRAGRVQAFQPYGVNGAYAIPRAELERLISPVQPQGAK